MVEPSDMPEDINEQASNSDSSIGRRDNSSRAEQRNVAGGSALDSDGPRIMSEVKGRRRVVKELGPDSEAKIMNREDFKSKGAGAALQDLKKQVKNETKIGYQQMVCKRDPENKGLYCEGLTNAAGEEGDKLVEYSGVVVGISSLGSSRILTDEVEIKDNKLRF